MHSIRNALIIMSDDGKHYRDGASYSLCFRPYLLDRLSYLSVVGEKYVVFHSVLTVCMATSTFLCVVLYQQISLPFLETSSIKAVNWQNTLPHCYLNIWDVEEQQNLRLEITYN